MANFKRGRRKNVRAGCLMCKAHKANGADRRTVGERRQDQAGFRFWTYTTNAPVRSDWTA